MGESEFSRRAAQNQCRFLSFCFRRLPKKSKGTDTRIASPRLTLLDTNWTQRFSSSIAARATVQMAGLILFAPGSLH